MSYVPRAYEDIVRDLLTTMTGGTIRESVDVPAGDGPIELRQLRNRPVRRISHLEGLIPSASDPEGEGIPYRFTPADFELISLSDDGELDAIRFREGGRKPFRPSTLTVNYYPVQTSGDVPLTDVNVGSVTRTLLETFARELALSYLHLEHVYNSAFLELAEGSALDRVVALVGVQRLPAGHALANLRFSRGAAATGRITVPVGTGVVDGGGNRYLTLTPLRLEPGESTREVLAAGESTATEVVEAGQLNRLELLVAGISEVVNPQPAYRQSAAESDDALRLRARGALHVVVRGTNDALRFGLLSIPGVKEVNIIEHPNDVAGEIRIEVAYSDDSDETRQLVSRRIDELRPAGIRIEPSEAARRQVNVRVALTLAGAGLTDAELTQVQNGVEKRVGGYLGDLPPGGVVRRARLSALALEDERIVDADIGLIPVGLAEVPELTLSEGEVLEVLHPFAFHTPVYEDAPGDAPATRSTVSIVVPLHLGTAVTTEEATSAINLALDQYLASRGTDAPVDVDGILAAIRDDSRFAVVRSETIATIETTTGQFRQLSDGLGSYTPAPNETMERSQVDLDVREGAP